MEIVEITPDRWAAVRAFIGDDAPDHVPRMTLVAEADDKILGALVCDGDNAGGYSGRVFVDPEHKDEPVASTLIDKATRKLQMRGVNCWRFDVNGHDAAEKPDEPFWSALIWPTPPAYDDARHVTRVRGVA